MSSNDFAALGVTVDASKAVKGLDDLDRSTERVVSSASKLGGSLAAQTKQMQQANTIAGKFATEARTLSDAELKMAEAGDKFIISLQRQVDSIGKTKNELLMLRAAELGVADDAKKLIDEMANLDAANAKSTSNFQRLARSSSDAREDIRIFAESLASGNIGMAAAQLGQFTQRAGMAQVASSLLLNPITAGIVAFGTFAAAAYQGAQESAALADALKLTGGQAGITEGQFNAMAASLAAAESAGIGAARDALMGIVSTGRFTSESLQAVGQAAMSYAKVSGQSADDVVKQFSGMADGVVKWATKHNEQHHFISLAQLEHIDGLEKQGQKQRAMAETAKLIDAALATQTSNLGIAARAWRTIKNEASGAWDAMKGIGRASTVDEEIGAITSRITSRHRGLKTGLLPGATPEIVAGQDALDVKTLTGLYSRKFAEEKKARDKEADNIKQEQGIVAKGYLDKLGEHTKGQSLIKQKLAEYDKQLAAYTAAGGKRSAEQIAADKKQIAEQYKEADGPKGRTGGRIRETEQSEVKLQNETGAAQLDAIKRATDQQQKAVDYAHKNGLISDAVYYKAKTDLAEGAAAQELTVMTGQMQALLGRAKFRDDVERNQNAQEIVSLNAKISAKQQDVAWTQMQNVADAAQAAETRKFNDLLFEQKRIQADLKAGKEAISEGKRAGTLTDAEALQAADALYASIGARLMPIRDAMVTIAAAHPFDEKMVAAIAGVNDQLRQAALQADEFSKKMGRSEQDALTSFLTNIGDKTKGVKNAFADMASSVAKEFLKMEAAAASSKIMSMLRDATGAKAGGSVIASIASSLFANADGNAFRGGRVTAFANGGAFTNSIASGPTVAPMALFGEAGPEAIMPLSRDGSGKLGVKASGGGGAPSFVFQNTYNVAADADKAYVQRMVEAGNQRTQAQIADQMKRNRNAYGR